MASTKSKKVRKVLAVGLAVVGVAGMSLAAASQLSLTNSTKFQAGSTTISADCQGTTPIPVTFGTPALNATTGVYSASTVVFSGVKSTSAECGGLTYKVAVKTPTGWSEVTTGTPTVPTTTPAASTSVLTVSIPAGVVANDISGVSLTIYS